METSSLKFTITEPIPLNAGNTVGWKDVPLSESSEKLVPLGLFSDYPHLFTSSIYYGEHDNSPYGVHGKHLEGANLTVFVRERVAERLTEAQNLLPANLRLVVFDGRRSFPVQKSLHSHYLNILTGELDLHVEVALVETEKYVSYPSTKLLCPSPHLTGGAVDVGIYEVPGEVASELQKLEEKISAIKLTLEQDTQFPSDNSASEVKNLFVLSLRHQQLVQDNAQLLNFGTPFDFGGPEAALTYYENLNSMGGLTEVELDILGNRRLLYGVMSSVELQAYSDEWWHYNAPESQMGAQVSGTGLAVYGLADLTPENLAHEQVRVDHWGQEHKIYLSRGHSTAPSRRIYFPTASTIQPSKANLVAGT